MPCATAQGILFWGIATYPRSVHNTLDSENALYIIAGTIQCLLLRELQSGKLDVQGFLPVCANPLWNQADFLFPRG